MKKLLSLICATMLVSTVLASDLNFAVVAETSGLGNGSIDMTITGGVAPYVYSWSGPSGFSATTEDISSLTTGTYTITVTDKYCGVATTTVFVDVTTGIVENTANLLQVYPNPGNSLVTISSGKPLKNANVKLVNVAGVTVYEKDAVSGTSFTIDISALAKGMYFLEILSDKERTRKTLIKE